MQQQKWTYSEVLNFFNLDANFLEDLIDEEIICPMCEKNEKNFSCSELEKLQIAKNLFEELNVNIPGIEVILGMRNTMIEMRKQFDKIIELFIKDLNKDYYITLKENRENLFKIL
ncbi:MAG: hypothetical protein HQK76_03965 [Desulfobacterales bacterium]|nr:hypothetical protein [Desulfobacterales bacterium]